MTARRELGANAWRLALLGGLAAYTISPNASAERPAPAQSSFGAGAMEADVRAEPERAAAPDERRAEVGLGAGFWLRGDGQARVDYSASGRWSAHGTIFFLPWLGLRLSGGMEYLSARVDRDSLGLDAPASTEPRVMGPHVIGQVQPRLALSSVLEVHALIGIGWQRLVAESFSIEEPTPLVVNERAGVVLELPLGLGLRHALGDSGLGVSLSGTVAFPLEQTGALFDSGAGAAQSVRQDSGQLERVGAFQPFGTALGAALTLDMQL